MSLALQDPRQSVDFAEKYKVNPNEHKEGHMWPQIYAFMKTFVFPPLKKKKDKSSPALAM